MPISPLDMPNLNEIAMRLEGVKCPEKARALIADQLSDREMSGWQIASEVCGIVATTMSLADFRKLLQERKLELYIAALVLDGRHREEAMQTLARLKEIWV